MSIGSESYATTYATLDLGVRLSPEIYGAEIYGERIAQFTHKNTHKITERLVKGSLEK